MKSSKASSERMGLEWSLKPITVVMKICGIPASHTNCNRFLKYLFHIIVALALSLNISYNINSLINDLSFWIEYSMYLRVGKEIKVWNATEDGYKVPGQLMDVFMVMLKPLFIILIFFD